MYDNDQMHKDIITALSNIQTVFDTFIEIKTFEARREILEGSDDGVYGNPKGAKEIYRNTMDEIANIMALIQRANEDAMLLRMENKTTDPTKIAQDRRALRDEEYGRAMKERYHRKSLVR